MKKFLVFAALFAATFMMMSCGGSDNKDDNKGGNGGNTEENGGNTEENGGSTGDNGGSTGDNGGNTGDNGGSTGDNGGSTGDNGGSTGDNGGNTGDNGGNTADSGDTENDVDPADSGEGENEGGESDFATEAEAYLPASYADKTLDAWYMLKEEEDNKIKIEAIFLFNDNSLVKTSSKVYSAEDGREPKNEIDAEGTFTITSGNYDNGTAQVEAGGMQFEVSITEGVLSAMNAEFIKQDNADAPEPK